MPVLTINPLYNNQFVHGGLEIWQDSVNSGNAKAVLDFHSVPRADGSSTNYDARIIASHETGNLEFQFDSSLTGGITVQKGGLTVSAGGANITGNVTITSGKLITPNNTLNTMGDDVEIGDGNIGGCLVIHGLNAATGISFKPYSGSTEQRITTDGSGTMTVTGSVAIGTNLSVGGTAYITGQIQLDSSSIDRTVTPSSTQYHGIFYRDKNDKRLVNLEYCKLTDGTARLNIYVLEPGTTEDSYGGLQIYRLPRSGTETAGRTYSVVGNYSVSGAILRNITVLNSGGTAVGTQYIKMTRK